MIRTHRFTCAALIGLGAIVAGCTTAPHRAAPPMAVPFPVEVAESIERLELYTRVDGLDLSARDKDAVNGFLRAYGKFGNGPIYVNVPNNAAGGLGAKQAQAIIAQGLSMNGLSPSALQTGQYQVASNAPAPVVVSYRRLKTLERDCRFMDQLTFTGDNQPSNSFGCSISANFAAMIQDPRQLLDPYDLASPNSQRRMEVYDKYIKGENTAAEQPDRQEISAESN